MDKHITGHFDHDLYRKIRRERKRLGMTVADLWEGIKNHELIGREFISKESSVRYTVESVEKHWWNGWYEEMIIREDISNKPRFVIWKNISCREETVLNAIDTSRADFFILTEDGRYVKTC